MRDTPLRRKPEKVRFGLLSLIQPSRLYVTRNRCCEPTNEIRKLSYGLVCPDCHFSMPEAPSDIDYTVVIGRHETIFRANTPKGEEFLGGLDLTMSNEDAHTFIQDARAAGLTVRSYF